MEFETEEYLIYTWNFMNEEKVNIEHKCYDNSVTFGIDELDFVINSLQTIRSELLSEER